MRQSLKATVRKKFDQTQSEAHVHVRTVKNGRAVFPEFDELSATPSVCIRKALPSAPSNSIYCAYRRSLNDFTV
jgi:hypothetical protein